MDEPAPIPGHLCYEALEQTADAVYITDTDGSIEYVNPAFEEITGYERAEALGKTPRILSFGEHDESYYEDLWETIRSQQRWESEIVDETKGGERIVLDQTISPVTTEDGEIEKFVAVARDVTERKERERELDENRRRLALALAESDSGVWEWDPATNAVHWHESCERLFGLEPGVFEGTFDAFFEYVHDDDREQTESIFEDAAADRESFQIEGRVVRADGETRWLRSRGEFVETLSRYIGVVTDITEHKERQRDLELLKQIQSRILRHNLRNQLQIVKFHAESCSLDLDGEYAEKADWIISTTDELEVLIEKVRTVERFLDREPSPTTISLQEELHSLVEKYHEQFPSVSFTLECPSDCEIETLPEISHAFDNLIDNAARHNDGQNRNVAVRVTRPKDATVVTVADDGPGIPDQELRALSQREETALTHSTGIGLWFVQWIVGETVASLHYETDETGTEFTIRFPR